MSRKVSMLVGLTAALLLLSVTAFFFANREDTFSKDVLAVQRLEPPAKKLQELLDALDVGEERVVERWDLRQARELEGWSASSDVVSMEPTEAGLHVTLGRGFPLVKLERDYDFDDFNALRVRLRIGEKHQGGTYRVSASWNWGEVSRGDVQLYRDAGAESGTDGIQTVDFMLGQHGNWGRQEMERFGFVPLFLDYPTQPDTVLIESIELLDVPPKRLLETTGWTSEDPRLTYEGDTRPAYPAPLGLDWRSDEFVPDEETTLAFGAALPRMMAPVGSELDFVVEVWQGEKRLGPATRRTAKMWSGQGIAHLSHECPLRSWAGEKIHLRFFVEPTGQAGGCRGGLWIEPRLMHRGTVPDPPRRPRRVVLVTLDTTRPDYLGPYGNESIQTPFLDELARRGTLFETCYATANSTNPSHASILTSLHVQDHGVDDNSTRLGETAQTLAEAFRAVGYRTAAAVSIYHLDHANSGFAQGFDHFIAPPIGTEEPRAGDTNERLFALLDGDLAGQPLFLWVHYFDPHAPYTPPGGFDRMYYDADPTDPAHPGIAGRKGVPEDPGSIPYWSWLDGIRDPRFVLAQYAAEITYTDQQLRALYERLTEDGVEPVFVVTADHGESLGEHEIMVQHVGLYDPVSRVPLIFSGLGVPANRRVQGPVSTVDVAPTLLDLAALPALPRARGTSLRSYFDKKAAPARDVIFEHAGLLQRGYRRGSLKYLRGEVDQGPTFEKGREEVYDLVEDPGELKNLATPDSSADLEALRALYQKQREQRYQNLGSTRRALNPDLERILQGLGYAGSVDAPSEDDEDDEDDEEPSKSNGPR